MMACEHCIPCQLERIAAALEGLIEEVAGLKVVLSRPAAMRLALVSEREDGMLKFVVTLPPVGAPDVVRRDLKVLVADQLHELNPAVGDTQSAELSGNDNDAVHCELVDVDDAGNRSQPSVLDAVLVDTLAPPQPGVLGITITGEE